jgi:hypothetical protein
VRYLSTKRDINSLTQEFILRHQLSCVKKWKLKAELWRRKQSQTKSVDDYVATMQATARRPNMPEPYLADAIMQGLHPELTVHVLHSKPETVEEILEAARVSEVAHSANTTAASQMESLTAKLDLLLTNMVANKNEELTTAPKKVTFTQAVVVAEKTNRSNRERAYSPVTRSPNRSPVRSSGGYELSARLPRREWSDNNHPSRRETDRRRKMTPNRQQPTSWRAPFNGQRSVTSQNISFQNQPYQRQPRFNSTLQQRSTGNCTFCGGSHQVGRQFCLQQIYNVLIVQRWATWPEYVVVAQRLKDLYHLIHNRDSHPGAFSVRGKCQLFNRMKTFLRYW